MNDVLNALSQIDCTDCSHDEWLHVGMALKNEGYGVEVWDNWSQGDPARYHPGECDRRWQSFRGSSSPITGATIIRMAQMRGWTPYNGNDGVMDWDDVISYDGDPASEGGLPRTPCEELALYLSTLFEPDEHVGYVTGDAWQNEEGRWVPARGVWDRTAGELMDELAAHPDDLGAVVGDWKTEAGAWIRFNPLDGEGVRNENVTSYRFALVESDSVPMEEQAAVYRKLELPVAALVSSGRKSLHAIVHIDAPDAQEYRKRVTYLYDYIASHGMKVDTQNRNPSRLSRMPGVTRNGVPQKLLGINMGRKSWMDWMDFVEGVEDELPGLAELSEYAEHPPALPDELISGILRRGHKMLISGSSKAGKSFLLMELCAAIAEGQPWLGFPCRKGRVMYVNLEIDPASCVTRFLRIYDALGYPKDHLEDIVIWNLRGHAVPLDKLVPKLVRRVRGLHLDAIIIDPIYKVITGDENSASDMAAFCNQFDRICNETGCSTIYCHHHSKGAQGGKRAMDRASGSGVFARDPDAQLDMIELEMDEETRNLIADRGATAWRLESSLREFPNIQPLNFWFEYPVHRVETGESLKMLPTQGSVEAGRMRNQRSKSAGQVTEEFRTAYEALNLDGQGVTVSEMSEYLGLSDRTIRERVQKLSGEFDLRKGVILKNVMCSTV